MRFGWRVFPLLLGLAIATPAFADAPPLDQAAEAKRTALFEEGRKLHLAGKHAEAVVKLREVVEIRRSPQALRALGLAEQDAGKPMSARTHFEEALKMATEAGPPSEIEPAKKAIEQVRPLVPRIRVTLPAEAVDATLMIDGASLVLKDGMVEVDPGSHTLTANAVGMKPFAQTVEVAAGGVAAIDVKLAADPSVTIRRPLGIAIAGVGVAGLVAGAVTGILAIGAHDELSKTCAAGGACPKTDQPKIDGYHALGLASTVSFVAGGVLAVGGAVMFFTAPHGSAKRGTGGAAGVRVTPFVGVGSAGIRGVF